MRKHTVHVIFLLFLMTPTSLLFMIPPTPSIGEEDEPADLIGSLESSGVSNDFPIVFIHGIGAPGPGELFGFNAWGGLRSIPDALREAGYTVFEVKVGPISSSWDRAVEAFYRLKGGTIDYGIKHANDNGHNQLSRSLEALYPEWGEIGEDGYRNKIHIISHSAGGPSSRCLVQMLGDIYADQGDSQLFTEDLSDWVASVTTLSSPHDGTTFVPILEKLVDEVLSYLIGVDLPYHLFIAPLAFIAGAVIGENAIYDLMLDQFGIFKQNEDETFIEALGRIFDSLINWIDSHDFAMWDNRPEGAAELNGWVEADPDVYYFSYSTTATAEIPFIKYHIPWSLMCPLLYPSAAAMGFWTEDDGPIDINKDWCENDGIVNTISMNGPKLNSGDTIVSYNPSNLQPGVWNDMGKIKWDHVQIIGMFSDWTKVKNFYLDHVALLAQLPKGTPVPIDPVDTGIEEIIELINATQPIAEPEDNPFTDETNYNDTHPEDNPNVTNTDADMDGMIDKWEDDNGLNSSDSSDADGDLDGDLLINSKEYFYGTNAQLADSDLDGLIDSWEVKWGLPPMYFDSQFDYDVDNLINTQEYNYGTDPYDCDTDGDGYYDGAEVAAGTNPTDANDHPFSQPPILPPPEDPVGILLVIIIPSVILVAILFSILSLVYLNREKPELSKRFKSVGKKFRKVGATLSLKKERFSRRVEGTKAKISAGIADTKEKISEIKEKRALKVRSEEELLSEFQDNYIDFDEE